MKDNSDTIIEQGVEIGSDIFLDGLVGQIAPGIVSCRMSHKQKQHEERTAAILREIMAKQDGLNNKLNKLSDKELYIVEEEVFPLIFEYAIEEPEKEKIKYIVNGFETIIENKITDQELILSYYDVLKSLRLNEIRRLIEQTPEYRQRIFTRENELKLNIDLRGNGENKRAFIRYIDNKLEQLGLIQTVVFGDEEFNPESGPITPFGINFMNFIREQG